LAKENDLLISQSKAGDVFAAEEVVRLVSKLASKEVEGVGEMTTRLLDVFSGKDQHVSIEAKEDSLSVEISVSIVYGYNLLEVAQKVQYVVSESLKLNFGLKDVHVHILIKELIVESKPLNEEN